MARGETTRRSLGRRHVVGAHVDKADAVDRGVDVQPVLMTAARRSCRA
jgi:hypothetical protein